MSYQVSVWLFLYRAICVYDLPMEPIGSIGTLLAWQLIEYGGPEVIARLVAIVLTII